MTMPKQGDTQPCVKKSCDGTQTYHENLDADLLGHPEKYPGWRCDTCGYVVEMKMRPWPPRDRPS